MKLIFYIIILISILSCNSNVVFEKYTKFNNNQWHTDSIVVFNYGDLDTSLDYKIYLNIRHDIDYKYRNLFLFTETKYTRDTIEIHLCDKQGKWYGKGMSNIREVKLDITEINNKSIFRSPQLKIEQAMRYGKGEKIIFLKHINHIGITILKQHE